VFGLPTTIWSNGSWSLPRDDLPFYLILLGWTIFLLSAIAAVRIGAPALETALVP
jgi:hypothetical protein